MIQNYIGAFKESRIPEELELDLGGLYLWRGTGESHMWNPTTISLLQHSTATNNQEKFNEFEKIADNETEEAYTLRGLLDFNYSEKDSIAVEEVESALNIVKRFATGAISLGSISKEAHETLAVAMNRIGARSNTGEGGEDSKRFKKFVLALFLGGLIIPANGRYAGLQRLIGHSALIGLRCPSI